MKLQWQVMITVLVQTVSGNRVPAQGLLKRIYAGSLEKTS